MRWIPLTENQQLDDIIAESHHKPIAIYKHSTRCSVSLMVKKGLESEWRLTGEQMPVYYLDLLTYRPISNRIAEVFAIEHESPQLIIIRDGKPIYSASQSEIIYDDIVESI
jgi:bacillithiol system protein YtxJ